MFYTLYPDVPFDTMLDDMRLGVRLNLTTADGVVPHSPSSSSFADASYPSSPFGSGSEDAAALSALGTSDESDGDASSSDSDSDDDDYAQVKAKKAKTKQPATPRKRRNRGTTGRRRLTYSQDEKHGVCVYLAAGDRLLHMDRVTKKDKEAMMALSRMEGKRVLKMLDNARNHPFGPFQERALQRMIVRDVLRLLRKTGSAELSHHQIELLAAKATRRFLAQDEALLVQPKMVAERLAYTAGAPLKMHRLRVVKRADEYEDCDLFPLFHLLRSLLEGGASAMEGVVAAHEGDDGEDDGLMAVTVPAPAPAPAQTEVAMAPAADVAADPIAPVEVDASSSQSVPLPSAEEALVLPPWNPSEYSGFLSDALYDYGL